MNDRKSNYAKVMTVLIILLISAFFIALSIGRYSMNPLDVIEALLSKAGIIQGSDPSMENILFSVRLPRILSAVCVGGVLSLSGAVYQGVFQNPLVSPDILGVSSGAGVGAAIAVLLGVPFGGMQLFAFAGGLSAVGLTMSLPKLIKNSSNMAVVLSGIIVGGFMMSAMSLMKFVADPETELSTIVFWEMGSVSNVLTKQLIYVAPLFLLGTVLLLALSWRINIISFGESEAKSLGINIKVMRAVTLLSASLLTASAVSISGTIGWIGLVVPHLGRLFVGADNTKLLPVTVVLGGLFLLVIDTFSRVITTASIPLSVLTGFVGAPFYAWLLYKQKAKVI